MILLRAVLYDPHAIAHNSGKLKANVKIHYRARLGLYIRGDR